MGERPIHRYGGFHHLCPQQLQNRPLFVLLKVAAVLTLAMQLACAAQRLDPPRMPDIAQHRTDVAKSPASVLQLDAIGVALEKTTLQEVGLEMRNVIIRHEAKGTDADSNNSWLCNTLRGAEPTVRLWFLSDDTIGGGREYVVTGIHAKVVPTRVAPVECPVAPHGIRVSGFDTGIWIGSTVRDLVRAFGEAPVRSIGWWRYENRRTEGVDVKGQSVEYSVTSRLDVRMAKGVIVELRASQVSTS
jgi:hypothetical protein